MSRSLLEVASRAAQSLVLAAGVTVAIGETSERYDASRQVVYATQQLTERHRRLGELRSDSTAEQPPEQPTDAHWIQRETPKFPYIVAFSPADNPAVVTPTILGSSGHIIGSPAASTDATLASILAPVSPVDALVRVVACRWTALKRRLHGDVPMALLDPQRNALRRQLRALHTALEASSAHTSPAATGAIDSEQGGDHEREASDKLVFWLRDFDLWDDDDVSTTLWLQWIHDVTHSGLAHVVVPTTQTVTPATIRKWQQRHHGSPCSSDSQTANSDFVAILLRVATGSADASSAHDKLRVLSQLHALELVGLDSSSSPQDEELLEREAEEDAGFEATLRQPTETQVIVETVGNWWSDLARVCEELSARGLREVENREERLVLVQSVCDTLARETVDYLLQSLAIQESFSDEELQREQRISALQAWKCLEVVTRVGDNATILASPQTLLQNKKHDATPLNCASAVDALMPFNQRTHGEATFMELLDKRVLFLRPKSNDVAIGVVPCDATDLVAPCWVETSPLIKRAFEKLWRDDFHYLRVLELERFEDNHKLSEEIALFEQEITEKRLDLEKKSREFILLQRVMKESDVATRKAELALLELEIQSKRAYLERLRELLD